MDYIEKFEHRGFTVKICYDPDPTSPREWDNLGKMVCWHRRYTLGDEQPSQDPDDYLESLLDGDVAERLERRVEREHSKRANHLEGNAYFAASREIRKEHMERVMAEVRKHYILLPLYLYDHSGITMRTSAFSCPWDSGQVGYILADVEKVRKEYGCRRITPTIRRKVLEVLKGEVEVYARFLEGGFTGYVVEDAEGNHKDSCWGFDDPDYCKKEATSAADWAADSAEQMQRDEALAIEAECRALAVC